MRIAVVGAGISGLTAAYYLGRAHDVDLYERNAYAGGHTRTVEAAGRPGLDVGFMVYNEASYEGFSSLLAELGVQTQPSEMSFSVRCTSCRVEYSSRGIAGMLASPTNVLRPDMLILGLNIMRFYQDGPRSMADGAVEKLTVKEYVHLKRFDSVLYRHFIVPLLAAVWSTPPALVESFPAQYFLRFVYNHGLIGGRGFRWRTVRGGAARYVERLLQQSHIRVKLSTPVRKILRTADGARLHLEDGEAWEYDRVVLATHADETLALLGDAGDEERAALRPFTYTPNRVVLHTDSSFLPRKQAARASWNYTTVGCRGSTPLSLTYYLNRLQAIESGEDFCVTVNPTRAIPEERILHDTEFAHPRYTFETLEAQRRLAAVNGRHHTHFAGAYTGYGFHEDGYASGRAIAAALGPVE